MPRYNSRAKREARKFAAATGVKYAVAREATRLDAKPRSRDTSPMVQTAKDWAEYTLMASDLAALRARIKDLQDAEIQSAAVIESSVDWELIEEFDGDTRLHSLTFQVEAAVRGLAAPAAAAALVAQAGGEIVEDLGADGVLVLLRPRVASVDLVVREENDEREVSEVAFFVWED